MDKDKIIKKIEKIVKIKIQPVIVTKIDKYMELLIKANKKVNLTAIKEEGEIWRKHILDSLLIFSAINIPEGVKAIDIGTGAGIPGIIIKICRPDIRMTLLEAKKKKVDFIQEVVEELELDEVKCIWGRAEEIGKNKKYRERYELAVNRGVANLNVLAEYSLPLVKIDGIWAAYKGPNWKSEYEKAKKAIHLLGGEKITVWQGRINENGEERSIVVFKKAEKTPERFPRRSGMPAKRPIE